MAWLERGSKVQIAVLALSVVTAWCDMAKAQEPSNGSNEIPAAAKLADGFESGPPRWVEEETDATFVLRVHERTKESAHEGRGSERFVFEAGPGSVLYYSYPVPRAPITDALRAVLYARSNRIGVRLYGRVVLPNDRDPETGQPSFLLIQGSAIDTPDRWQRLELSDLPLGVQRQARVLRVGTQREVKLDGAYLDRLVINLYGGSGQSEVFLDDLSIGPLESAESEVPAVDPLAQPRRPSNGGERAPALRSRVILKANYLERDGRPWIPRAISAPISGIESLRRAGLDVFEMPANASPDAARRAVELGYSLAPKLGVRPGEPADELLAQLASVPDREAVAFWSIGDDLGRVDNPEDRRLELTWIRQIVSALRQRVESNSSNLCLAGVADLFPQYALFGRNIDLIAVEPPGYASAFDPMETLRYLNQCRMQTSTQNPNAFFWAWVPASAPPGLRRAIWGHDAPPAWGWPAVQPEQIRLMAFAALSAGYRGLGFRGDAELARDAGLDRLYELTLLIAEIELVEEVLARGTDPIPIWPAFPPDPEKVLVYNATGMAGGFSSAGRGRNTGTNTRASTKEVSALPTVRAAAIDAEDKRTKLLIVSDQAQGAQWQPSKMAYYNVNLLIPAPESAQAFEIVLGDDIRKLDVKRDAGGRRITLPRFNTSALVLLTTDMQLIERIRQRIYQLRPRACDIAIKQAELRLDEALRLTGALRARGVTIRDQDDLLTSNELDSAKTYLAEAKEAQLRQDYQTAWGKARNVAQPIRMVMRAHFDRAFADLRKSVEESLASHSESDRGRSIKPWVSPVACPPLLSVQTLPQYYYWREFIRGARGGFGFNLLTSGAFNTTPDELRQFGWTNASHPSEGFVGSIRIDSSQENSPSGSVLKLVVRPEAQVGREAYFQDIDPGDANAVKQAQTDYDKARQKLIDALPSTLMQPIVAVRSPAVAVRGGDFLRIRVRVRLPLDRPLPSGGAGLIVRDSLGDELLQFRTNEPSLDWREVVLYRRVAESGEVSVLLGLAGIGEAYFDDLRIEVLGEAGPGDADGTKTPLARRLEAPSPTIPAQGSAGESTQR